ncbi:hypothetical protein B0T24DRAFT_580166 [Lasiosphaeria ovina]|uniref:DUF4238 domain-containing protein n=1 Tax=Lasiosphaeria ovina TaxID=92902 RepID=A0AAE0K3A6_9PEZI|nr:hypothetical protein B0T24DRAFT_580166 [Lasiosphaeria ovina]
MAHLNQYQHFVPKFLLRNFAHPYSPENVEGGPRRRRKGGGGGGSSSSSSSNNRPRRKPEKGMYRGDPVVRHLDLTTDPAVICEKPLARVLGRINMYKDTSQRPEQQQHIETLLSKLESHASGIFRRITTAFAKGEPELCITRDERNLLRKFLFILKYRNAGFYERFHHQSEGDYDADDREEMRAYMAQKGFARPLDVWFDNIKAIIELDMDAELKWMGVLQERIYPVDATGFIIHVQSCYMAIITPSDPADEFILTDGSYSVHEGPTQVAQDADTGQVLDGGYMPLHEFAPVSPKLMIVLRSVLLPDSLEDAQSPRIHMQRAFYRFMALDSVHGFGAGSLLHDLPIAKAGNSYSRVQRGPSGSRLVLLPGEDGTRKPEHKFYFPFVKVERVHVDTINAILLENCHTRCTSVVFESQDSFARTLEAFLSADSRLSNEIMGEDADAREAMMKKFADVSKRLGSTKQAFWTRVEPARVKDEETVDLKVPRMKRKSKLARLGKKSPPDDGHPKLMEAYTILVFFLYELTNIGPFYPIGGSWDTLFYDVDQCSRMWKLRVKIDSWSQGVAEEIRQRNRHLLEEAYLLSPPQRLWMYIMSIRYIMVGTPPVREEDRVKIDTSGPEDTIARARHLVRPNSHNRLMWITAMNDIDMRRQLSTHIWAAVTFDFRGIETFYLLKNLVFERPGSIRNCGIPEIEDMARKAQLKVLHYALYKQPQQNPLFDIFDEGEKIEIMTRMIVRIHSMLAEKLSKTLFPELNRVLFDITYPTPPPGWFRMR